VKTTFDLFALPHLLVLATVPLVAGSLAWLSRQDPRCIRWIRFGLGGILACNELIWYGYKFHHGWIRFPDGLPLHLCDVTLWLTVISIFTSTRWSFELAYFWGLAGTTMAILTPDVTDPFPSYHTIQFFLAHGGVVTLILYLTWASLARPRQSSVWRAFGIFNAYGIGMGIFNLVFETNYLYICRKPPSASLLDYFGPWPGYVVIGDLVAFGVFMLLSLPLRASQFLVARKT